MNDTEERLSAIGLAAFGTEVGLDVPRDELPVWDSLNHLKLVIAFESEFGSRIPVARIETIRTLRELGEFI